MKIESCKEPARRIITVNQNSIICAPVDCEHHAMTALFEYRGSLAWLGKLVNTQTKGITLLCIEKNNICISCVFNGFKNIFVCEIKHIFYSVINTHLAWSYLHKAPACVGILYN